MTGSALAWILVSACLHALWNFLFKRANGTPIFMGLSKMAEVAILTPVVLTLMSRPAVGWQTAFGLSVGGALFALAVYILLSMAYAEGDLSFVYPVSRGSALCILPILGYLTLGERVDPVGVIALATVGVGIIVMQLPTLCWAALQDLVQHLRTPTAALAIGTGLLTAGGVLWDKWAIQSLPQLTYFYGYTALTAVAYATFLMTRIPRATVRDTWVLHRSTIVCVAVCNTCSYLLVLLVLRKGTSSYVVGLRQLSIGFGAFLGWRYLGEPLTQTRLLGIGLLLIGCILVSLA